MFFYLENRPLSSYYTVYEAEKDYICSTPKDNGLHRCEDLPHLRHGEMICNDSARAFTDNLPSSNSCVNWNMYYTMCKAGDKNPFQGAMSFDNIGLAWVSIFLVSVSHYVPYYCGFFVR